MHLLVASSGKNEPIRTLACAGRRLIAVCGFALSLLLAACSPPPSPELRLGTNIWTGYEPLYLADDLGFFPEKTVRLVEFLSASEVIRAFRNESIEAAALTLDEALILLDHQIPVRIVLVTDISSGGDAILAKPGIESVKDLVGKRIGVEGNALGAYVLSRALDLHGVSLDTITVVRLEISEQEAAYQDNTVDAIVTFEPVRSKVITTGANEIFNSREIPEEIVDVVVVHESYLLQHEHQVAAIVNGWYRALDHLDKHPADAAIRMSGRLRLKPDQVLDSFEGMTLPTRQANEKLLGGTQPQLLQIVERLQSIMLDNELLTGSVAVDSLFTPSAAEIASQ